MSKTTDDFLEDVLQTLYHSYNGADSYRLPIDQAKAALQQRFLEERKAIHQHYHDLLVGQGSEIENAWNKAANYSGEQLDQLQRTSPTPNTDVSPTDDKFYKGA